MTGIVPTALALGVVYGLVGAAVATVATATRTLHLAVGPILVSGVLVRLVLGSLGVPDVIAVTAAVALGALLSASLEPLVLRPLRTGLPHLVGLAVAAGVIEAGTARLLGTRTLRPAPLLPDLDPVVTAVLLGVPLVLGLALAVDRTRWGRRLRLVGGGPDAAARAGVDPARVRAGVLAVAGVVAVLAGLLVAPIAFVSSGAGAGLTVRALAAALVLGRRTPLWALAGGAAVGLVEALALRAGAALPPDLAVGAVVVVALLLHGSEEHRAWGRVW